MPGNTPSTFTEIVKAGHARLSRAVFQRLGAATAPPEEAAVTEPDLCRAATPQRERSYAQAGLPEPLLRAFSDAPLPGGDGRFIGREPQIERLNGALDRWRAGGGALLAITGPQGCGISSLLHRVQGIAPDALVQIALARRPLDEQGARRMLGDIVGCTEGDRSTEDLLRHLDALPRRVFVIDNGCFLASRIFGAQAALKLFLAVMVASQNRHLWILGVQQEAWQRLIHVHDVERYFARVIELGYFTEAELGECLSARLAEAGLRGPDATDASARPAGPEDRLPRLHKLSGGKCDLAFYYHLSSMRVDPDSGALAAQPIVELDFAVLNGLSRDDLFALAELAAHGRLTAAGHQAIFRNAQGESLLQLERLRHQCLVERGKADADPEYRLMPLFSNRIIKHLKTANVLY